MNCFISGCWKNSLQLSDMTCGKGEDGLEEERIEETVVDLLKKHHLIITTAESCTGGMIGSRIVSVSGASDVYQMGFITYCDEAKHRLLQVRTETLEKYTAVSEQTAAEMAAGGAKAAGADVCIAVTGYAGPGGGTKECPPGTVFISCYMSGTIETKRLQLEGDRSQVREGAAAKALELVCRRIILKYESQ